MKFCMEAFVPLKKDDLKIKMTSKWRRPKKEDNLKNEDGLKNEDDFKNEDNLKIKTTSKMKPNSKWRWPKIWKCSQSQKSRWPKNEDVVIFSLVCAQLP